MQRHGQRARAVVVGGELEERSIVRKHEGGGIERPGPLRLRPRRHRVGRFGRRDRGRRSFERRALADDGGPGELQDARGEGVGCVHASERIASGRCGGGTATMP